MEILCGLTVSTVSLLLVFFVVFLFSSNPLHTYSPKKLELQTQLVTTRAALYQNFTDDLRFNRFTNRSIDLNISQDKFKKLSEFERLELGLAQARVSIKKAMRLNVKDEPRGLVYRNPAAFLRSYYEMEKRFKVYVYEEGERPIVHGGPCKDIYTSEGRFIHEMELDNTRFRTRDPRRAHVYFMPFSVSMMVKYLYIPDSFDKSPLLRFVSDYVSLVSTKYPFWNRTSGADHFMLSCHDWGPEASFGNPLLYNNSIRVLCNANTSEGFDPKKDVALPEIYLYDGNMSPDLISIPPDDQLPRKHLGFFAGGLHGPIRPLLFQRWKNRDPDLLVYEYLPKDLSYYSLMLQSRFCLCPSGFEVASPRIVEAIYAECVPVVISEHYVLPFSDVLRWEAFSIQVKVSEIPDLKEILRAVPEEEYKMLKEGVKAVKKHFMLNQPPQKFDVFHMILHSIWLRRINIKLL